MKYLEAKNGTGPAENKARRVRPVTKDAEAPATLPDADAPTPSGEEAGPSGETPAAPPAASTPASGSRKPAGRRKTKG